MSVLNVLATWLSLHAEQRVDFIQEIADQADQADPHWSQTITNKSLP